MIDLIVCSPLYAESLRGGEDNSERRKERLEKAGYGKGNRSFADGVVKGKEGGWTASAIDGYGQTSGQLGGMKEGIFNLIEGTMNKEKTRECVFDEWNGLYSEGWQGVIVEDAFAH